MPRRRHFPCMDTETAEEYLRHQSALRALARTLVADESDADDVVQDTWLAAMKRPPGERANLKAWLSTVARNLARQVGRADDRRKRRELVAALPERLPAADEVAERAKVHRELVDLVLAMEEPYRATMLLRYFEGRPSRAIATELGEKVATIQQRLLRGRQRLREALDQRYGKRTSWRGFFVLALGGPEAFLPPPPPLEWVHALPPKVTALTAAASTVAIAVCVVVVLDSDVNRGEPESLLPMDFVRQPELRTVEEQPLQSRVTIPVDESRPELPQPAQPTVSERAPKVVREPSRAVVDELRDLGYVSTSSSPPGLRLIQGGRTKIGTRVKDIEPLILANQDMANRLVGETPRHTIVVDDFHLMVTEVTNEQYAEFVRATGARPPYSWAGQAVAKAQQAWREDQEPQIVAAARDGWHFAKFEPEAWWEANWEGQEWEIPADIASHPVTYVSFDEATAYARWAGLRLMTEFEHQRAGRGGTDNTYPWGDKFDARHVAGLDEERETTWPVGSFPSGSREGFHDLVGNVWEWTSSPYRAFPGFKAREFKVQQDGMKKKFMPYAPFEAHERVIAGGSIHMDSLGLRLSVRMSSGPGQRTNGLGFRCALSSTPGRDLIEQFPSFLYPGDSKLLRAAIPILQRWTYRQPRGRPAEYAVITGHDVLAFVPRAEIAATSVEELQTMTRVEPVDVGILHITRPAVVPELQAGTYRVRYRSAVENSPAHFIFSDDWREGGVWWEATPATVGRAVATVPPTLEPGAGAELGTVASDVVRFAVQVPSEVRGQAFRFELPLQFAPGEIDATWR